jgi:tRNA threonylcarbamoyladenosine modification (KEOPS) complex Cgi121 subunit
MDVLVAGIRKIDNKIDTGKLLDRLRTENLEVVIQAVDAAAVYGRGHALGALSIAMEAMARKIMIANKPEIEVLLRLACTNQIAEAMRRARLREGSAGCIIAFSVDAEALKRFKEQISREFKLDDTGIYQSDEKRKALAKTIGISLQSSYDNNSKFLDLLLERAAILVRT